MTFDNDGLVVCILAIMSACAVFAGAVAVTDSLVQPEPTFNTWFVENSLMNVPEALKKRIDILWFLLLPAKLLKYALAVYCNPAVAVELGSNENLASVFTALVDVTRIDAVPTKASVVMRARVHATLTHPVVLTSKFGFVTRLVRVVVVV